MNLIKGLTQAYLSPVFTTQYIIDVGVVYENNNFNVVLTFGFNTIFIVNIIQIN